MHVNLNHADERTDAGLQPESTVSQLSMVPLQNTHAGNSIIQADRVLMVSGSLSDSNFGTASSALFDGQTLIPYIVSESLSGSPGMVASLFRSFATFSFNQRRTSSSQTSNLILMILSRFLGYWGCDPDLHCNCSRRCLLACLDRHPLDIVFSPRRQSG